MIIGLTDKPVIRRDGKIRCGTGPKTGGFKNSPHFLLRDAEQLIPVLGAEPTEIFFTFHSDNPSEVAKIDLRWYSQTKLLCQSMHNTTDKTKPIGQWAVYRGQNEVPGMTQEPYLGLARTRKRQCDYKGCAQYQTGDCGEHLFLNIMIPQYSMGSIFTLDSVSILAVVNALGLFEKAGTQHGGKFSGEIYRMFKKEVESEFFDTNAGKDVKRKQLVVQFAQVNYQDYITRFGNKISPENMHALEALRARGHVGNRSIYSLASDLSRQQEPLALVDHSFEEDLEALPSPEQVSAPLTPLGGGDDKAIKDRGNHPALAALFVELSTLAKVDNSELNRYNVAKTVNSVENLATYLKAKIAEHKKRLALKEGPVVSPHSHTPAHVTGTALPAGSVQSARPAGQSQPAGLAQAKPQPAAGPAQSVVSKPTGAPVVVPAGTPIPGAAQKVASIVSPLF